jgi:2,3-bisphosphoglycerate-independent phosphoglycerate mutase
LVKFSIIGNNYQNVKLKDDMALCDVAPTMLEILGIEKPTQMTGESILIK